MAASETPEELLARASALRRAGRVVEAIAAYEALLAARPELPDSWYNLAWLQRQARRFESALASYQAALDRGVAGAEEVHLNRAVILADHLGRPEAAAAELEGALAIAPDYVPALLNLGNLHEDRGDRAAARAAYERARKVAPDDMLALARLAGVAELKGRDDPLIGRIEAALKGERTPEERSDLGFALGRALDSVGDYDAAFAAYEAANEASRQGFGAGFAGYDQAAQERFTDRLIAAFPEAVGREGYKPNGMVFICGMFRSGSTLAEQILARHSAVTPGGELDLLPALVARELQPYPEAAAAAGPETLVQLRDEYLAAVRAIHPDARLVTDKRPDNFLHIGLIKTLFPAAKIIHTVRDPLDNLLSLYFLHLDPGMAYALDLEDAAHWHGQYRRLMAHWKSLYPEDIFDLDYDALVAAPEAAIRGVLDFLGLEFEAECLAFHEAPGVVKTASVWQVREPLYRRASGRWRNYEKFLGAVREALEGRER